MEVREFIEQRIADDERIALAVQQRAPWVVVGSYGDEGVKEDDFGWVATGAYNAGMDADDAAHIARHDPARVLRDVEAKRALLAKHARGDFPFDPEDGPGDYSWTERCDGCHEVTPCSTMRLLAAPFSDHADFDPSWSPEATA